MVFFSCSLSPPNIATSVLPNPTENRTFAFGNQISGGLKALKSMVCALFFISMVFNAIVRIAFVSIGIRLRETGHIKGPREGHSQIVSHWGCIPDNMKHYAAEPTPSGIFSAQIPSRNLRVTQSTWSRGEMSFSTDGSKFKDNMGGGVLCQKLLINPCFRRLDHCSVLQGSSRCPSPTSFRVAC